MNMNKAKLVFNDPTTQSDEVNAAAVAHAIWWVAGVSAVVLLVASFLAFRPMVDHESAMWLVQTSARLNLIGIWFSVAKFTVSLACGLVAGQIIENSDLGKRMDGKVIIFAATILAAALVFGGVPQ